MAKKPQTCGLCGGPETPEDRLNYDHIIPKALGGPHEAWNLRRTHKSGNSARNHTFTEEDAKLAASRKHQFENGRRKFD